VKITRRKERKKIEREVNGEEGQRKKIENSTE
jgi:hypothetical protein